MNPIRKKVRLGVLYQKNYAVAGESLRFVVFFKTLLMNLAKIGASGLAVAPRAVRRGGQSMV